MKIFFDTEFTGLHQNTTLISIGCVAENGRTFYAELLDYDRGQVTPWIQKNVIANLKFADRDEADIDAHFWYQQYPQHVEGFGTRSHVAVFLHDWLAEFGQVEMWSDCLAYDWVLFCQLWGGAMRIDDCIYYIPFDLATLLKIKGWDPDTDREQYAGIGTGEKHNALHDAKCIKALYDYVMLELREPAGGLA